MSATDPSVPGGHQDPAPAGRVPDPAAADPTRPARPRRPSATVLRTVPGTRSEWVIAAGQIAGLLLALAEAEAEGHPLPAPWHDRHALRAWARLAAPVLAAVRAAGPSTASVPVVVPVCDADTIGVAARELGRVLCEHRVHGTGGRVAETLLREARALGTTPERLVAQLARVHGVLDVDPWTAGPDAGTALAIWRAGA